MIAGCIESENHLIGKQLITLANASGGLAQIPFDKTTTWQHKGVTLIQQTHWNSVLDKSTGDIICHDETGVSIVGWLRLYNAEELKHCLKLSNDRLVNDATLVFNAYLKWGEELCQHLIGDFAFVLYDPRTKICLLARDQMGVRPLYYYQDDQRLVFATSIPVICALKGLDLSLSKEWLSGYLIDLSKFWNTTVYNRIHKLPAGHYARYRLKQLYLQRYFEITNTRQLNLKSDQEYVDAYRELLHQAVKCRVNSDYPIASESSGGLDSSTIVAFASANMTSPDTDLSCYGYAETPLEAQRILAVSHRASAHSTHLFTHNVSQKLTHRLEAEKYFIQCNGIVHENSVPIGHQPIYKMANTNGARTLLSGFGGDEFVTNQAHLARFDLYHQGQYPLWLSRHRGNVLGQYLRALKSWHSMRQLSCQMNSAEQYLQQVTEKQLPDNILLDSICQQFDLPNRQIQQLKKTTWGININALTFRNRWREANINRLESCTLAAAGHGLESRWPLLDIRLIQFYLSIPPEQKLGPNGYTRYLHRRAARGMIPDEIGEKTGMGPAFPTLNMSQAERFIYTNNEQMLDLKQLSSPLQELIDESKLERLLVNYSANPMAANTRPWFNRLYRLDQWLKMRKPLAYKT